MYYVYALIDPRDSLVHYVGLTGNVPTRRIVEHLQDRTGVKAEWLAEMLDAAFMPTFVVLQTAADIEQATLREAWWISTGEMLGWPLTNIASSAKRILSNLRAAQPSVKDALVENIKASREHQRSELQAVVWQWRDAHPDGTQSQMRADLESQGVRIARGYAHELWHKWTPTGGHTQ